MLLQSLQIEKKAEVLLPDVVREAIATLLAPTLRDWFGAAKAVEHEVAAVRALQLLGAIRPNADEFRRSVTGKFGEDVVTAAHGMIGELIRTGNPRLFEFLRSGGGES